MKSKATEIATLRNNFESRQRGDHKTIETQKLKIADLTQQLSSVNLE
jgi:hypothetical protein